MPREVILLVAIIVTYKIQHLIPNCLIVTEENMINRRFQLWLLKNKTRDKNICQNLYILNHSSIHSSKEKQTLNKIIQPFVKLLQLLVLLQIKQIMVMFGLD